MGTLNPALVGTLRIQAGHRVGTLNPALVGTLDPTIVGTLIEWGIQH